MLILYFSLFTPASILFFCFFCESINPTFRTSTVTPKAMVYIKGESLTKVKFATKVILNYVEAIMREQKHILARVKVLVIELPLLQM